MSEQQGFEDLCDLLLSLAWKAKREGCRALIGQSDVPKSFSTLNEMRMEAHDRQEGEKPAYF